MTSLHVSHNMTFGEVGLLEEGRLLRGYPTRMYLVLDPFLLPDSASYSLWYELLCYTTCSQEIQLTIVLENTSQCKYFFLCFCWVFCCNTVKVIDLSS